MADTENLTVPILCEIRDELITTRTDLGARIDAVRTELGARIDSVRTELGARIGHVEETLVELAEQQRFVVRHLSTLSARDHKLEADVDDLRARMEAVEKRLPG